MSYNVPVRHLQGGSALVVASSGTVDIQSGGSIQVESGGVIQIAAGGSVVNAGAQSLSGSVTVSGSLSVTGPLGAPNITLGGTQGKWAFGTAGLASGVGTIATGLTTVVMAQANVISGVQGGAGSMSSAVYDDSLRASGSVIFRGLAGTLAFTGNNGTIAWFAMGL